MRTSKWQLTRLSVVYLGSQSTMFLIPGLIQSSAYQGWMGVVAGGLLSLVPLYFTIQVGRMKPGIGWVDFGAGIMGKWGHRAMVLLIMGWCVFNACSDLENFVLFFGANYLRGTPPLFIQIVIALVIMYTASLGFKSIAYMSDGIFLIFVFATVLSIYIFMQTANTAIIPAFIHYHDPQLIFKDAITVMSYLGEWVVFLFIAPEIKISSKTMKALSVGGLLLIAIVVLGWVMTMMNFGAHLGKELQYPYLQMVRSSSRGHILGNSDALLIGIWSSSMFIHGSLLIYVAYKCALYLTKQKAKNFLIPILTAASLTIAYLYSRNITKYRDDYDSLSIAIFWLFVEFVPMYYFIVAKIRSKLGRQSK